ncbi:MAG: flagellar protein FlaG [Sulfuritalea sp.]|nr:flagellar protein FlaG [Sulfuritalea sp.]
MIVQNSGTNLAARVAKPVSDDVPKVVSGGARQAAPQEPSAQQLQSAVGALNRAMQLSGRNLEFSVDPSTKKAVVQVMDAQTGELIRQIPSREVLAIAQSIDEYLQRGVLLKQEA